MPQEPAHGTTRSEPAVEADPTRTIYRDPMPVEANPDDVYEQRLEVPLEDEDYPPT